MMPRIPRETDWSFVAPFTVACVVIAGAVLFAWWWR